MPSAGAGTNLRVTVGTVFALRDRACRIVIVDGSRCGCSTWSRRRPRRRRSAHGTLHPLEQTWLRRCRSSAGRTRCSAGRSFALRLVGIARLGTVVSAGRRPRGGCRCPDRRWSGFCGRSRPGGGGWRSVAFACGLICVSGLRAVVILRRRKRRSAGRDGKSDRERGRQV